MWLPIWRIKLYIYINGWTHRDAVWDAESGRDIFRGVWPTEKHCKALCFGVSEGWIKGWAVKKTGGPILTICTSRDVILRKELPAGARDDCTYVIRQTIYIYSSILFLLSSSFLFPRLISAVGDWMSTIYFHTWCGLSANLECRSEMCCTLLAENTGRKKVAKNRHLGTIAKFCRAISSQLRHLSTIGKKLVKHQYVLHRSS